MFCSSEGHIYKSKTQTKQKRGNEKYLMFQTVICFKKFTNIYIEASQLEFWK